MITLLALAIIYATLVYILFVIFGSLLWAAIKVAAAFAVIALIYRLVTGKRIIGNEK